MLTGGLRILYFRKDITEEQKEDKVVSMPTLLYIRERKQVNSSNKEYSKEKRIW